MPAAEDSEENESCSFADYKKTSLGILTVKFIAALLLFICVSEVYCQNATARFGDQIIPVEFIFGDDQVLVRVHKPDNAPDNFRETENLHIFSKGLVALKDTADNKCIVKEFNETEKEMKDRLSNATYTGGFIGDAREGAVDIDEIPKLSPSSVLKFLGTRIAAFCVSQDVYYIGETDYKHLTAQDTNVGGRRRRSAQAIIIVNVC